jgi:hypothetical protein
MVSWKVVIQLSPATPLTIPTMHMFNQKYIEKKRELQVTPLSQHMDFPFLVLLHDVKKEKKGENAE